MASRKKLNELIDFFQKKISDLGIFRVESEDFEPSKFEELVRGQTLFQNKYVVVCNKIFESLQVKSFVERNIGKIANSQNIFLFIEEDVDEKLLALFKQFSRKIQEFKLKKIENKNNYNPFAIGDAVAKKNKTRAWVLFQQALLSGATAEEIFYKIAWQIRALLLIKQGQTLTEKGLTFDTGLHPFVVQKNLNNIKNFTEKELADYSFQLLKIYHDTRRGLEEFPLGLEKFLINLK